MDESDDILEDAIVSKEQSNLDGARKEEKRPKLSPDESLEGGLFAEDDSINDILSTSSSSSDHEDSDTPTATALFTDRDAHLRRRLASATTSLLPILSSLSPAQQHRYETFRRVGFPRPAIKRLVVKQWGGASACSSSTLQNAVIVVAGIAKVFVGELVEEALQVGREWGDIVDGNDDVPLLPCHYREAYRRLVNAGKIKSCTMHNSNNCIL